MFAIVSLKGPVALALVEVPLPMNFIFNGPRGGANNGHVTWTPLRPLHRQCRHGPCLQDTLEHMEVFLAVFYETSFFIYLNQKEGRMPFFKQLRVSSHLFLSTVFLVGNMIDFKW